jgi:hypothetical protein
MPCALIKNYGEAGNMKKRAKARSSQRGIQTKDNRETDTLRLNDLAKEHGLVFTTSGATWFFDDYSFRARSLGQALAFAEGFDRAIRQHEDGA